MNDNPRLPMLSVGGADLRDNAKQLATIMALETVQLVLPNIRQLTLKERAEFCAETRDMLRPFRPAMLQLSKELNFAILSDASLADVQRAARFIVETTVAPQLEEMKDAMARPTARYINGLSMSQRKYLVWLAPSRRCR